MGRARMRRVLVNSLVVYGLPVAVILVGFVVGRNFWFSPHSYGWLILFTSLLFSLGAQLIRIARSPSKVTAMMDSLISLALFVALSVALLELMPNYWPNWS